MIVKRSYVVIFSSLLLLSVGAMAQDSDVMTKHSDWDENINIKNKHSDWDESFSSKPQNNTLPLPNSKQSQPQSDSIPDDKTFNNLNDLKDSPSENSNRKCFKLDASQTVITNPNNILNSPFNKNKDFPDSVSNSSVDLKSKLDDTILPPPILHQNNINASQIDLKKLEEITNPKINSALQWFKEGVNGYNQGRYLTAKAELNMASSIAPNWASPHFYLAMLNAKMDNQQESIKEYLLCLKLDKNGLVHRYAAMALDNWVKLASSKYGTIAQYCWAGIYPNYSWHQYNSCQNIYQAYGMQVMRQLCYYLQAQGYSSIKINSMALRPAYYGELCALVYFIIKKDNSIQYEFLHDPGIPEFKQMVDLSFKTLNKDKVLTFPDTSIKELSMACCISFSPTHFACACTHNWYQINNYVNNIHH